MLDHVLVAEVEPAIDAGLDPHLVGALTQTEVAVGSLVELDVEPLAMVAMLSKGLRTAWTRCTGTPTKVRRRPRSSGRAWSKLVDEAPRLSPMTRSRR